MQRINKIIILCQIAAIAIIVAPAQAQLCSQSFPDMNYTDDVLTDAEFETAKTTFANPGILPDNPMYFMKKISENMMMFFAFSDTQKAELHVNFAKTRLAEAYQLIKEKKHDAANAPLREYQAELHALDSSAEVANNKAIALKSEDLIHKGQILLSFEAADILSPTHSEIEKSLRTSIEKGVSISAKSDKTQNKSDLADDITNEVKKNAQLRLQIINKSETALAQIREAESRIGKLKMKIANLTNTSDNSTYNTVVNLLNQAQHKLADSWQAFNDIRYGEAFSLSTAAEQIAENAAALIKDNERGRSHLATQADDEEEQDKEIEQVKSGDHSKERWQGDESKQGDDD